MILTTDKLKDVYQTAFQMRRLVESYYLDLGPWLNVPFLDFYRYVCDLPYIPDPHNIEFVSRAALTINPFFNVARDCDDKAVLLGCWWHGHGDKCRFVASSTKKNKMLHHVFLQHETGLFFDATYCKNKNFLDFYPYFPRITKIIALTEFF